MAWDIVYRDAAVVGGGTLPEYGWELTTSNTGLARLGIDGESLPIYTGPDLVPAGTTISLKKITNVELFCHLGNITIDRCLFKPSDASDRNGLLYGYNPDYASGQLGPVTVQDCDFNCSEVASPYVYSVSATRGALNVLRCNIWGMGTGIAHFGYPGEGSTLIEHNYVHDLRAGLYGPGPEMSHNEAGTIRGYTGSSLIWRKCKLISNSGSDSGALFIQTYDSNISNVLVEDNYFETPNYGLRLRAEYGHTYSAMSSNNNRFGPCGYGPAETYNGPGWASWTNNYGYNGSNPPTYAGASVPVPNP